MSIEFPLRWRNSALGPTVDPTIILEIRTSRGFRGRYFVVDTGAEFSTTPRRVAEEVGQAWDTLPTLNVRGVGPADAPAKLGLLPIRIGGIELTVRRLFPDHPNVPLVLGCVDVLDRYALTIDAGQGKIVFTEIV